MKSKRSLVHLTTLTLNFHYAHAPTLSSPPPQHTLDPKAQTDSTTAMPGPTSPSASLVVEHEPVRSRQADFTRFQMALGLKKEKPRKGEIDELAGSD